MLTLRFQRQGKKRDFIFRVIAIDSKVTINSGKSKEILGWWDPRINKFELKKERILYWISQGAQPSDSCYNLLIRAKIIEGKKRPISLRKKKEKKGKAEAGEKNPQTSVIEEKSVEDKSKDNPEEKIEEKPVDEKLTEIKAEEKIEEKIEEKVDDEKREDVGVKEEVKEELVEDKKEESKTEKIKEPKEEVSQEVKKDVKENDVTEENTAEK